MIEQFRRLNPVNILYMAVISLLLRLVFFLQLPSTLPLPIFEPFKKLMLPVPEDIVLSPVINVLIAATLVLIQALWANKLVNDYNLLGKPSFLTALLFITVSSLLSPFLTLSIPLIGNFFIIWIAQGFLSIHRKDEARSVMYNLGMIVGAATLLYFPFISMLLLLWISLVIFRPFNWREWVAVLMGFITIYFFIGFFYYWNNSLDKFYQIWFPLANKFVIGLATSLYDYIVLIPVAFIFILAAFSLQKNFFRSYIQIRKSFQVLFVLFVLAVVSLYLEPRSGAVHFILAALPASVFMAYYFLNARVRWFYESVYIILVGCIIYFQFL